MLVMKFGGTSLAGPDEVRQVGGIIRRFAGRQPVVVVSAMAGVTDELIAAAGEAVAGQPREMERRFDRLRTRHLRAARALGLVDGAGGRLERDFDALFAELRELLHGILLLRELTRRSLDLITSFGERLSARLMTAHLQATGLRALYCDARDQIVTDDSHGAAVVDFDATIRRIRARLLPRVRAGKIPMVTGFIGRTRNGATTTLGRSGSDYSAAILAGGLRAREIWIWKEVDGVCTADPEVVPSARVIPRISYQEAAEMAHFGAEVIHPKAMLPARRAAIPIRIKNTFRPAAPGTVIGARSSGQAANLVISSMAGMALVTIEGSGIFGQPGMVMRLLTPVALARTNIYMISMSSSEYNVSFAIREEDVERTVRALQADFRERGLFGEQVARITVERGMCAIAVVGAGMRGQHGVAGRLFSALGASRVNVVAIAQGSSEYNITMIVRADAMRRAVRAIHQRLNTPLRRRAARTARRAG
ncbi:MAG TPA: aspartate kinase [Candidatus Polarisedimenticolia bacterium]|nr:aspartate kinase [Candidatus Polarisedimenticolia bacterium]